MPGGDPVLLEIEGSPLLGQVIKMCKANRWNVPTQDLLVFTDALIIFLLFEGTQGTLERLDRRIRDILIECIVALKVRKCIDNSEPGTEFPVNFPVKYFLRLPGTPTGRSPRC